MIKEEDARENNHKLTNTGISVAVGYTMRDIRYKWNVGEASVGISSEVELPQFRVLGHRQRSKVENLSTGKCVLM